MPTIEAATNFSNISFDADIAIGSSTRSKIRKLPEPAREIAKFLQRKSLDYDATAGGRLSRIQENRREIVRLKGVDPSSADIRELENEIAMLDQEHMSGLALKGVWDGVAKWLSAKSLDRLQPWRGTIPKGDTTELIAAHQRKILDTERAPINHDEARQRALADAEALIKAGEPDFLNTTRNLRRMVHENIAHPGAIQRLGGGVRWPRERIKREIDRDRYHKVDSPSDHFTFDGLAFAAWLNADLLRRRIAQTFDALGKGGFTAAQRETELRKLRAELVELKYASGAATWKAIKNGTAPVWPPALEPPFILGLIPADPAVSMERFILVRASDAD